MQINTKERYNTAVFGTNTVADTENEKTERAADKFRQLVEQMIEDHRLSKNNIQAEDDWHNMSDAEWDKLIEHFDAYIDDTKEEQKERIELQEEAAKKGAAEAPADMRAVAAAKAALKAAANGISADVSGSVSDAEKLSWTYGLETDNQTVLAKAKMANEYADDVLTKAQELALTGDTSEGIRESGDIRESAVVTEDEEDQKTWMVTVYTRDEIICTEYKDGEKKELWHIKYKDPDDYRKVWDFLDGLDKDEDLTFTGSESFWENFINAQED